MITHMNSHLCKDCSDVSYTIFVKHENKQLHFLKFIFMDTKLYAFQLLLTYVFLSGSHLWPIKLFNLLVTIEG
jgi:hypothetical protein